ncbi:hypothetical protein ATCC90586_001140 [Pythium insidiosum]|nr:hypothetical protein ATCC90586_001140 [Pythium insidiosum]
MRLSPAITIGALLTASSFIDGSDAGQRAYGGGRQRTNVIVTMKERPTAVHDSVTSQKFSSRGNRLRALQDGLQGHATRTQARVRDLLQKAGASTHSRSESFWLTNEMLVSGATPELIEQLNQLPEVESVTPEQILPLGLTTFDSVIAAWRAAGIIPVMAAGNTGPNCGTVQSPGDHPSVLTVGATDASNLVARFSAKGPTVRGLRKPDVTAPGQAIRSSCFTADNAYCSKSGTSMAAPHVTGAIALYLRARPGSTFDQIRQAFQSRTTIPGASGFTCGTTPDSMIPNNQFGFGRIDVFRALS